MTINSFSGIKARFSLFLIAGCAVHFTNYTLAPVVLSSGSWYLWSVQNNSDLCCVWCVAAIVQTHSNWSLILKQCYLDCWLLLQELVGLGVLSSCQGWGSKMVDSGHHLTGYHLLTLAVSCHPQHCSQEEGQDTLHQRRQTFCCCGQGCRSCCQG